MPDEQGPSHPYIGASAGCWRLHGELMARDYGDWYDAEVHRGSVDAYAVQHPGSPERRSIGSVAVHLMALCMRLERRIPGERVTQLMNGIARDLELRWLEPPSPNGSITVADVLEATTADEHARAVSAWCEDVWRAWEPHHETVRTWLDRSFELRG